MSILDDVLDACEVERRSVRSSPKDIGKALSTFCQRIGGDHKIMDIYQFKVKDYTTIMIGQMEFNHDIREKVFYVQRGDGTKYSYGEYRVEWWRKIATI